MTTGQREQESVGDVPEAEAAETAEEAPETALSEETIREAQQLIERMRFSWDHVKRLLYLLKLCRYFDERMETLYRQGKLPGAIYSGRGQEGTHVGVAYPLQPQDSLFPTHRDLSAQLTKGLDLKRVMAQYWGRIDGYTARPRRQQPRRRLEGQPHVHRHLAPADRLPGGGGRGAGVQAPQGATRRLAICGDGATSNGRWHESLNVSAIHQLPVVWVVNNNQFAYSTPNSQEFAVPTIAERAAAYGMRGVRVDGSNVLEVVAAAREAIELARAGNGPTLLESVSLRWRGHAGHDPAKYVPKELLEEYMTFKDPVARFEEVCKAMHVVDDKGLAAIDERLEKAFNEAYEFAQASPLPEPGDVERGLWAGDGYWEGEPPRGGGTG